MNNIQDCDLLIVGGGIGGVISGLVVMQFLGEY